MTDDVDDFGERPAPRAPQGSSPYSTGGGGVTFERRVATVYLARLLTGTTALGLGGRRAGEVAFQQAPATPLDDLVISASKDDENAPSLELAIAVRRSARFVVSDERSRELIGKFLQAVERSRTPKVEQRLAICVAGQQKAAGEVGELAAIAADHTSDSFFRLIRDPGKFTKAIVDRLEQLSRLVGANLDDAASAEAVEVATWNLLCKLDVLMPRVEPPDETDWVELLNVLEPWAREQTLSGATALRDRLESLAAQYGPRAAVVDVGMLRRDTHDLLNVDSRRSRQGWTELRRLDGDARAGIRSTVGVGDETMHLDRTEASASLTRDAADVPCLLVTGESGVGKSALVRDLLMDAISVNPSETQAVILNLRLLPRLPMELREKLGIPLAELLSEMSAPRRVLVIDSAEYAVESGSELLRHLLESARKAEASAWVISTTDGFAAVRSTVEVTFESFSVHEVSVLDDAEIEEIGGGLPQLAILLADPRARELLRRPVVADLLARVEHAEQLFSESDVLGVIWDGLVRRSVGRAKAMPDARDQVMRRLAQQQLYGLKASEVFDELDPGALQGLRHDGLVRDPPDVPWAVLPEFSHEMVRTFALAKVLLADGEPVDELLAAGAPRWVLPAARTAAQELLAAPDNSTFPIRGRLRRVQASFDRLVTAGHGERWSDLPIEAALALPNAGLLLGSVWEDLTSSGGTGILRLLRIVRQRYSPGGLVSLVIVEPVVRLLLEHGWPHQINGESEELLRDWLAALLIAEVAEGSELRIAIRDRLVKSVTEGDRRLVEIREERVAGLAARTPEQVKEDEERKKRFGMIGEISGIGRQRRWVELPPQLTDESATEKLALLGPDLGESGAELLRRVARDAPNLLAPALEEALTDRGLATYRPSFLTELAMAYYVDDEEDDEYGGGFMEDGIRDHHWRGPVSPLAAYYRGPFLVMFQFDFRNAVAFTNAMLNHAAEFRSRTLQGLSRSAPTKTDLDTYHTELSITGAPHTYAGDGHVWLWYRGTGVGPYPCMSALQALEVVCDRFIDAGIEPERLVPILLEGCENLAMPALVVGMLVRHLEQAGKALDPFLCEPAVWHLEFSRTVSEHSGLRSQLPEVHNADRRSWSLRDVAARLALSADDDRAAQLKTIGEQLMERATDHERTDHGDADRMSEEVAAVKGWAGALDRAAYRAKEVDDGILVEQVVDQDVQDVLGPTNQDLRRGNRAMGLVLRYRDRHDHFGPKEDVVYDDLLADVALGREVASDPPLAGAYGPFDAPAAVAAGALEYRFIDGWDVPLDDLVWSARFLIEVADHYRSAGESDYEFSYFSQGADRAAARALPFVSLPDAHRIREGLSRQGIEIESLERASNWLTGAAPAEATLFYAKALDHTWRADCDNSEPEQCHHGKAMALVEDSTRMCLAGPFNYEKQAEELHPIAGPIEHALDDIGDRRIVVPRLSAAIRALGTAATTDNCCAGRARQLLEVVLDAHTRGMLAYEHSYQHSDADTLIAARAMLASASVGDDSLLRGHITRYVDDSRLLAEVLRALAAAAEENEVAAAAARSVWPGIIDQVLDLIDEGHRPNGSGFFEDEGIAALIPNPSSEYGYLHREIDDEPIEWTDVLAWGQQIDRWLGVAEGSHRCVDSLVHLLYSLPIDRQGEIGLKWVESLVAADPTETARRSFLLAEWLHKIRPYLDASDLLDAWQRIVDCLVVAGDRRMNDLAD